jgi:hypothetical protein
VTVRTPGGRRHMGVRRPLQLGDSADSKPANIAINIRWISMLVGKQGLHRRIEARFVKLIEQFNITERLKNRKRVLSAD